MDFYRPQYSIPREGEIESPSSISQKTTEFAQNNFDIIMSRHIGQNNDLEFISLPNNVDYQIFKAIWTCTEERYQRTVVGQAA